MNRRTDATAHVARLACYPPTDGSSPAFPARKSFAESPAKTSSRGLPSRYEWSR